MTRWIHHYWRCKKHVSQNVWNGALDRVLRPRRGLGFNATVLDLPTHVKGYLQVAGFLGVAQVNISQLDHNLISALAKRWRPETHTFHMPFGECIITLQDVAILCGLCIDGPAVIGVTHRNWKRYVDEILGVNPADSDLKGSRIKLKWLEQHFGHYSQQEDNEWWRIVYTRAYILWLIGCLLLPDHSGGYMSPRYLTMLENFDQAGQYSWDSTVLSYLYRELCKATNYTTKEICGFMPLVQIWAWERMSSITLELLLDNREYDTPYGTRWRSGVTYTRQMHPLTHYRCRFDKIKHTDIVWYPYDRLSMATLPMIFLDAIHLWKVVLICFNIVEWHQPDRVMRQFNMMQHIPAAPSQPEDRYNPSLRGKQSEDWEVFLEGDITFWNDRHFKVYFENTSQQGFLSKQSKYMQWYLRHTRHWVSKEGALKGYSVTQVFEIDNYKHEKGRLNCVYQKLK